MELQFLSSILDTINIEKRLGGIGREFESAQTPQI
jgi:hypothetical protein